MYYGDLLYAQWSFIHGENVTENEHTQPTHKRKKTDRDETTLVTIVLGGTHYSKLYFRKTLYGRNTHARIPPLQLQPFTFSPPSIIVIESVLTVDILNINH
jgi:hypothetical protein